MATGIAGTGLVGRVARVAEQVLAPAASEVDASSVRRSSLDALAATGMFGMVLDPDVSPAQIREVSELLAAADAATMFVTAQHHLVARYVATARTPVRDRLSADLLAGRLIGGQGFSQLRRPGRRCWPPPALPVAGASMEPCPGTPGGA